MVFKASQVSSLLVIRRDHIWKQYVNRRQDHLWEMRGMKPKGLRSVDIDQLKRVMPIFRKIVKEELAFTDLFIKSIPEDEDVNLDQETIRRAINEILILLNPEP